MTREATQDLSRVCVKLYAPEPHPITRDAELFVPIFHEWIRDQRFDMVLFDVSDYAHAPDSPGIMLVAHEASFALDRSDGAFGLLAQRRTPQGPFGVEAVVLTLRQAIEVAAALAAEPRVGGILGFQVGAIRVEANDRLRAPNSEAGWGVFEPLVRAAAEQLFPGRSIELSRVENDPRDRLAAELRVSGLGSIADAAAALSGGALATGGRG